MAQNLSQLKEQIRLQPSCDLLIEKCPNQEQTGNRKKILNSLRESGTNFTQKHSLKSIWTPIIRYIELFAGKLRSFRHWENEKDEERIVVPEQCAEDT